MLKIEESALEIAILSFNKSSATIQLLDSIQHFEPQSNFTINVLDQGSDKNELHNLENSIKDSRVRLVKSERNLGVGGGRQKQLEDTKSSWILFLDNDLVLKSSIYDACLETMKFASFGCLPFIENTAGDSSQVVIPELFVNKISGRKYEFTFGLGSSSLKLPEVTFPKEISGVAGGVLLANVAALRDLGGIRGPGKAGYEDLDLSLRLRNSQKKTFLINIAQPLHHNKDLSASEIEKKTEVARLDPFQLRANAKFVEYRHKGHVWGKNQYEWIVQRAVRAKVELPILQRIIPNSVETRPRDSRRRLLLVCDSPGWAFDKIATKQKIHLANDFNIVVTYASDWEALKVHLFQMDWDAIVFLWRAPLFQLVREGQISKRLMSQIGYCVYDHQGDMGYSSEIQFLELNEVPVGVVNETLYLSLGQKHRKIFLIPDGVDTGLFRPFNSKRRSEKPLTIGWSGNIKWGGADNVKGYTSTLEPCIAMFQKEIDEIHFDIIDSSKGRLPQSLVANAMKNWDVVVCVSSHEGTPNPILEGLASGLVVISTPVGMTPELINSGARIRIISQSPKSLYEEIKDVAHLKLSEELRQEMKSNREIALQYDWRKVLINHKRFIQSILGEAN